MKDKIFIKSPMNYIGGKYKLLNQLIPLFPKNIHTFYDIFAGGLDVSINVNAKEIISNDISFQIINLYKTLQKLEFKDVNLKINKLIDKYELSKTNKNGYLKLRENYNSFKDDISLFTLICYSFNHNIRFNKKNAFNVPFGANRSSYNKRIEKNLSIFMENIKDIKFDSKNFYDITPKRNVNNFVYADPPYLLTIASYNENGGWNKLLELKLLNYLKSLHNNNIKFALSNVIENRYGENTILKEWVKENKFNIHYLNMDYSNSFYQKKDKKTKDKEVLITNYF